MKDNNFMIISKRLLIRQYCLDDAEGVHNVINNEKISCNIPMIQFPYPRETVDWWINFVNNRIENKKAYELGVFLRENQQYIGNCELRISKSNEKLAYIGYFIDSLLWKNGYASEAVNGMLSFGFNNLSLDKILGRCLSNNIGSRKVLEKAGFQFVNNEEEYIKSWDKVVEITCFELKRDLYMKNNWSKYIYLR